MHDIAYCNSKFDHLYKVEDRVIAFTGRATGLNWTATGNNLIIKMLFNFYDEFKLSFYIF